MKYLILIAALAATIGLAGATGSSPKASDCCDGGACCSVHSACCDDVE